MKMTARELREAQEEDEKLKERLKTIKRHPIYFILENVYDTYNVGGLFRLADALAIEKIYLCGQTEIPPNPKIKKASIGTYKMISWEYKATAREAINDLRSSELWVMGSWSKQKLKTQNSQPITIIAVEQSEKAIDYRSANYQTPLALLVGNETFGVLPETLELVDQIVEIPMWGINKSLNVIVSAAIVSYFAMSKI
ncbi:MAG: hypothetical protein HYW86_04910 [Candidatus Roizmanbacteria bacterium]|nr:MAG: hypothetical protein HYW86_04910 [Candidatus Roizmanbacteria bacterium]